MGSFNAVHKVMFRLFLKVKNIKQWLNIIMWKLRKTDMSEQVKN